MPIIILNWNGWDDTIECVRSIRDLRGAYNVWVVDNNSAVDRSRDVLAVDDHVVLIRNEANYGWSGGYNRALRRAYSLGHAFAYLLNNDTVVLPRFLEAVTMAARENENLAAVGSLIGYHEPPGYLRFDGRFYRPGRKKTHKADRLRYVDVVNGSGMLVRLEAMRRYGYFDERYFCYGEEDEWCRRMSLNGLRVAVHCGSLILHKVARSDVHSNKTYYRTRNAFIDYSLRGQTLADTVTPLLLRVAHDYSAVMLHPRRRRATIRAFADGANGRFGRRSDKKVGLSEIARFHCLLLAAALHRLLQSLPRGIRIARLLRLDGAPALLLCERRHGADKRPVRYGR